MPGLAVGRGCVAAVLTRSLTGSGPLTLRGVVFVLVRRSGLRRALGAHYAELQLGVRLGELLLCPAFGGFFSLLADLLRSF